MERRGPFVAPLKDCSDSAYLCAQAGIASIILPRRCDKETGKTWTLSGVTTSVVAKKQERGSLHGVNEDTYYLVTNGNNFVVFEYKPSIGVYAIYHDPLKRVDLAKVAKRGELDSLKSTKPHYYLPLNTFDGFGACMK